jgi:histidinol-phosphate aminotransferase
VPSCANFILVRVGERSGSFQKLLAQGIIVRPMDGYQFPEHVRVTVGTKKRTAVSSSVGSDIKTF